MTFSQDMDPLSLTTSTVTTTPSIVTTRLYDPPPPSTTSLTGYGCQVPEGQLQVIDAPPSGVIFLPSGSRTYRNTYFRGAVYWMDTGTGTLTFEDCIIEGGYGSWGMFTGGNGTGVVNMTRTTLRWRANGPERIYDQARGGGVVHTFGYEVHLDWCDISGWGDGVKVGTGASTIENCYIHDLMLVPYEISGNNFNDCISFSGGSGHVARNNILLSRPESYAGNSCIFFAYGFGGSALIESNYINGGVWTLFRDDGQSPGAQVTARNNQFGPDNHFAPYIGTYVEFSGNTFDVPIPQISGGQAPAPAPQPSTRAYTLTPVSGLPNSTTYTVTVRGGPTGVRNLQGTPLVADSSWTFTTAAAAPPPSPPPSGGGGASAAPLTVAAVGAGAEANMASVPIIPPTAPTGSGRLVNVSSSSALQTALNGAIPGDCIVLANGAYGGNFVVPADRQGTAANPIVIRAANRRLPSFPGGDGRAVFEVLGRYVYFSGLHLNGPDRTSFNMGGNNNVIHDCLFTNAGGWSSGNAGGDGQAGVIYTFGARAGTHNYGPDFEHWQAAMNSPLVNRFHTICANEFVGPRATVLWQGAGSVGNTFSHNIIRGPKNYTTTGDGMCIKVATGFGHEPCQLSIRFNSFLGWDSNAYYYLIGIKANNVTIEGNYIIDGTISIRSGDDCVIRNNAIETNGGIVLQGRRHVVEGNWCRSAEGDGGPAFFGDGFQKGPLVMFVRMLNGNFNGTTYPYWLEEVRDSTIRNNTFVRSVHRNDGVASFCNAGWQAIFEPGALIRNNQFLGNRFVAMVSPDRMIGGRNVDGGVVTQIMGVNTWQNNRFIFAGGAGSVVVPGGILGSNGNVAAVS